jgi:hypothetical protein
VSRRPSRSGYISLLRLNCGFRSWRIVLLELLAYGSLPTRLKADMTLQNTQESRGMPSKIVLRSLV